VLNGIAYDAKRGKLFVTGKRWSEIIEIEVEDKLR
jgi:glutamine cyclotransferase